MLNLVAQFRERELLEQHTEGLQERESSLPKRAYLGFDPTSNSLHLGNFQGIIALRWLQKLGWTPVVLVGGGTGMIGDPSGKSAERTVLERAELIANASAIADQLKGLLAPEPGLPKPIFVDNRDWLEEFSLIDFLRDVAKHFRVGAMLSKQSVRQRLQSPEGISFTEFSYQILQAYDFYRLHRDYGVSLQIGGSDQWGNITAGCDFVRRFCGKEVHGLTWPLLVSKDGKKFGKSESGALWLAADKLSPFHLYQHLLQTPDADLPMLMKRLTFADLGEIASLTEGVTSADRSLSAQRHFAAEVTRAIHGQDGLDDALRATALLHGDQTKGANFARSANTDSLPATRIPRDQLVGMAMPELLVHCSLADSRGEARRLIANGGISLNGRRLTAADTSVRAEDLTERDNLIVGLGKKRRVMVLVA